MHCLAVLWTHPGSFQLSLCTGCSPVSMCPDGHAAWFCTSYKSLFNVTFTERPLSITPHCNPFSLNAGSIFLFGFFSSTGVDITWSHLLVCHLYYFLGLYTSPLKSKLLIRFHPASTIHCLPQPSWDFCLVYWCVTEFLFLGILVLWPW